MVEIDLPYGNGKEVLIGSEWMMLKDMGFLPEISKERKNAVDYLKSNGYKVINSEYQMETDNAFYFTRCINNYDDLYFDDAFSIARNKTGITSPKSYPVDDLMIKNIELPLVFKNFTENGGKEKMLLTKQDEIDKLKKFFNEINETDRENRINDFKRKHPFIKNLVVNEDGTTNLGYKIDFVDYKELFDYKVYFQRYIETPTEYNTSLRVTTSITGDILAADLKYFEKGNINISKNGLFDKYLCNPASPYYINNNSIISNTVAGGKYIILGKDNYTESELNILKAHDIYDGKLPESVNTFSSYIAKRLGIAYGAVCGWDFIYDKNEKKWYFLEVHTYPMLAAYAEICGMPYDNDDSITNPQSHIDQCNADICARIHSLALEMKQRT